MHFTVVLILLINFLPVILEAGKLLRNQDQDFGDITFPDEINKPTFFSSNFHFHNVEFHKENPQQRSFSSNEETPRKIPLDFVRDFSNYNLSDLLLNFVDGYKEDEEFFASRFGDESKERSNSVIMAKEASCQPELEIVKLASTTDATVMFFPQCTRIERCGGCCSHALLQCQPTEVEQVTFKLLKTQYNGQKKFKLIGKELVVLDRHKKCKCGCRIKPEDCNKFQEYRESECRCVCRNTDEEKKCEKNSNLKIWNPDLCLCQCKQVKQCSTGFSFDQNDCRCRSVNVGGAIRQRIASNAGGGNNNSNNREEDSLGEGEENFNPFDIYYKEF